MWKSRVEIEQFFIAYFNLVTAFVRNSPVLNLTQSSTSAAALARVANVKNQPPIFKQLIPCA